MKQRYYPLRIFMTATATCVAVAVATASGMERSDLTESDKTRVASVTRATDNFEQAEPFESNPGGAGTTSVPTNTHVFSQPQSNLSFEEREKFNLGNALFRKLWVSSPATTQASDGLGPLYNARSCQSCHVKDGRGHLPVEGEVASSFLLQLGQFDTSTQRWTGDPHYGQQLQTSAVPGLLAEGRVQIDYEPHVVEFADGERATLRKPSYSVATAAATELDSAVTVSPRIAPPMIGMGLLEAIATVDIIAQEDVDDSDGDGVSGRASQLTSDDIETVRLGRFGWKAGQPGVLEQTAGAFFNDMGLSSSRHPENWGDCTESQGDCREAPHGEQIRLGKTEVPDPLLELVAHYSRNLAPPARRDIDEPDALAGKQQFYKAGCIDCHTPKYVTSRDSLADAQRFQLIWPYTDLLLHDMGDLLADGVGHNGGATGREWRTPPLWGVGLAKVVNPRATFLHDGRARTLMEAILWHGGEAIASQRRVLAMTREQREQLIRFLESL